MEKKTAIIIVIALVVLAVCAFVILFVSGIVLWQLGVFSAPSHELNKGTGFTKIKTFDDGIQYKGDGELSFVIMNAAGISAENVSLSFSDDCAGQFFTVGTIASGDTAQVSVECNPKSTGSSFTTEVTITYNGLIAGRSISYEDSGIIRGTVE